MLSRAKIVYAIILSVLRTLFCSFCHVSGGNAEFAGVDNTGVDISARCDKGGQCRSGQFGTMLQGWTLQKWTYRHGVARGDNVGVDNAGVLKQLRQVEM